MVVEVGVNTHMATCQTHICDLARLVRHKDPTEEEGTKIQTEQASCSTHFIQLYKKAPGEIRGFFASLSEEGQDVFTWGEVEESTVSLYSISGKRHSSQLILVSVVK